MDNAAMDQQTQGNLRETILDNHQFRELIHFFVGKASQEEPNDDPIFNEFYELALSTVADETVDVILAGCESPIERIFIGSVVLGLIKAYSYGIVVHQTRYDTSTEVSEFRDYHDRFIKFLAWYKNKHNNYNGLEEYLDREVRKGKMESSERDYIRHLTFRYLYLHLSDAFHLTIQPRFSDISVDRKTIRPDLYFWIPSKRKINIIVECDGFKHHKGRKSFITDRKRDRALQSKGFQVLRYSGTEIFVDPVGSASDLIEFLDSIHESLSLSNNEQKANAP